jgi:hypothetical protein
VTKKEPHPSEPYLYIALVLRGSEKQYLNLLKYVNNRNGAQVIYQCKSLTYLRVTREDGVKFRACTPEVVVDAAPHKGETQ